MHIDFEVSRFQTGYYEENLCASGVWPCCDIIYWGYNLKISFEGLSLSLSRVSGFSNGRVIEQISGGQQRDGERVEFGLVFL